eukprot:5613497-Pyramimonas_sp.AAC.1
MPGADGELVRTTPPDIAAISRLKSSAPLRSSPAIESSSPLLGALRLDVSCLGRFVHVDAPGKL